jgi:hypothetical protein
MSAIASEPIHLGTHPAAWNRVAVHQHGVRSDDAVISRTAAVTTGGHVRAIAVNEDLDPSFSTWSWTTLRDDCVILLGVVWSIPVAVLVIGTPVALAIAFLLWLARLTLHAF